METNFFNIINRLNENWTALGFKSPPIIQITDWEDWLRISSEVLNRIGPNADKNFDKNFNTKFLSCIKILDIEFRYIGPTYHPRDNSNTR
jgi:hypothetical protein